MADTVIYGTSGNDTIQANASGVSNGSLILTLAGTPGESMWPTFDVLINGSVVRSSVIVSANDFDGYTQQVYVQLPGTVVNSVSIDFTNDAQQEYASGDRNIFIKDVNLNGTHLGVASALYTRDGFTGADFTEQGHVITGQEQMYWGGEMTWSGSQVSNAVAGSGGVRLIDGQNGIDTVAFASARSAFVLDDTSLGFSVAPTGGGAATFLGSVERLSFSDGNKVAIDMEGNAGIAAKMITTLLGSNFLSNEGVVGLVMGYLDQGISAVDFAQIAATHSSVTGLWGGTSNAAFVSNVWLNLAGSQISSGDLAFFTGLLDDGTFTRGTLTLAAMDVDIVGIRMANAGVTDFIDYS
ncbi:MAG TPA: carbohydrate-binding domain-containing protein [Ramlibacter sp.]|nr:carbohydrate-binding domain-containing protein [Ramlibacter sp.]